MKIKMMKGTDDGKEASGKQEADDPEESNESDVEIGATQQDVVIAESAVESSRSTNVLENSSNLQESSFRNRKVLNEGNEPCFKRFTAFGVTLLTLLTGVIMAVCSGIAVAVVVPRVVPGNNGPCDPNPCQSGGTCTDQGSSYYTCECRDGYRGALCEDDFCSPHPCQNGGTCHRQVDGYSCTCRTGYGGDLCEDDSCSPNPCQNVGTCIRQVDGYSCTCLTAYDGDLCENKLCHPNPCKNRGICTKKGNDIACVCQVGFSGDNCEVSLVDILLPEDGSIIKPGNNGISTIVPSQEDRDILIAQIFVYGEAVDAQNVRLSTLDWVTRDDVRGKNIFYNVTVYQNTYFLFHGTCDCLNRAWVSLVPFGFTGTDEATFFWVIGCEPSSGALSGTQPRKCNPLYCPRGCGNHSVGV